MTNPEKNTNDSMIRIELDDFQKSQVKSATGRDAQSIELGVQELEERIAPRAAFDLDA